jgi:hypothetical protein
VTRWPSRLPPPRPEMPARLRCYDPAGWPDPVDWDEDAVVVANVTRSWTACTDPMGWWIREGNGLVPDYRQHNRYVHAKIAWCRAHGVDFLEVLEEEMPVRRAAYGGMD